MSNTDKDADLMVLVIVNLTAHHLLFSYFYWYVWHIVIVLL